MNQQSLSSFIWSVADLLRGDYKQSEYGKVILPFTVLRRLDCVLEPTKAAVLAEQAARKKQGLNAETLQQDRDHGDHRDLGWLPAGTGRRRSWREPLHRK
jgi:type I restriction-modification system DNA methylase subunit